MTGVAFDMDYQRFKKFCSRFLFQAFSFSFLNSLQFNLLLFAHMYCSDAVELQQFLLFIEAETNRDNGFDVLSCIEYNSKIQQYIFNINFILPLSFSN